ncbi:MAG: hypothetical protein HYR63_22985 [Proteobacteria bacterium]|nr:hypothetical protein [Pseudomonadota bacterium]
MMMLALAGSAWSSEDEAPRDIRYQPTPPAPRYQSMEQAEAKSSGCVTCHTRTDTAAMHVNPAVVLGCADCHGGDASVRRPDGVSAAMQQSHAAAAAASHGGAPGAPAPRLYEPAYRAAMDGAHVQPRFPETWRYPSSAKPERSYTLLNKEAPEFVRFINPSDYRVVRESCGACHMDVIVATQRSLMSTGAMLWGGASYNNGILPFKNYILGESYAAESEPGRLKGPNIQDESLLRKMKARGVLPELLPLPAWEVIPPGDIFRVFERGGRNIGTQFPEIGLPNSQGELQRLEEPGRPDFRQSNRGPGTGLRIAVPVINVHKTRLNDPFMWFLGTNDNPGDYRSSGCAGCHVIYANDRDPRHSGPYASFGNTGVTQTQDPTIPKAEPGHPLKHEFTRAIPTSQCMVCHMHQPNIFLNSMLGYTMWDYESDAPAMWPEKQKYPSDEEMHRILERNPEEAAIRGKWGDVDFLQRVSELNPSLKHTQFADYHGHGWNFRAVFKRDRKGNLLDAQGGTVAAEDPKKFEKAVHLSSVHVDVGMQCVDCHFSNDAHGNGYIYGEVANAIEIGCVDCHGSADRYPTLRTSGPAAPPGGRDFSSIRNADGSRRFEWRDGKLYQRSAVIPDRVWEVSLVKDTVDPSRARYNPKAARAKLMSKDLSMSWGPGIPPDDRAHKDEEMNCVTCHTSWTTSCAGCHLPIQANWKTARHHFEGEETRNFATYNPQVARDDMFQLGRHQTSKNNIIAPVRSTSALILSSTNINRERIYAQQPPIAASGYSSQAFAPHYPHTERRVETKTCTDCHVSAANDNNAIMAQLLLHGTNFVNFVGLNAWLGEAGGVEAVRVTEWDEPQAVIGSYLHRYAYPDWYQQHLDRGRELVEAHDHAGGDVRCLQIRGEYLYAAEGAAGMRVYDVASIANKGISQRIITAPFSPLGQDTNIPSRNATCVALPTNQSIAPLRNQGELMRVDNQEQPFHPIYHYAFITDSDEGLIVTNVDTLADGEARNNFLARALTWNGGGVLTGARHLTIAGSVFYVSTPRGVVVLDMDDPLQPRVLAEINLPDVRATALQFRYLFVVTARGLEVADVTHPARPQVVANALVPFGNAQRVYVARTYAYIAAGPEGLAIVDVERPEAPRLHMRYTADGQINDARDVIVGTTNATLYAYVADGVNGIKVIHLTDPDRQPNFYGFSPEPKPQLIAWRKTTWPAQALSKGLDRDRAVDETGHQIAVFGRLGSRPFTLGEQQRFYLDAAGKLWTVTDDVDAAKFRPLPGAVAAPSRTTAPPSAAPTSPGPIFRKPGEPTRPSVSTTSAVTNEAPANAIQSSTR